jgi:hypothetical protein
MLAISLFSKVINSIHIISFLLHNSLSYQIDNTEELKTIQPSSGS